MRSLTGQYAKFAYGELSAKIQFASFDLVRAVVQRCIWVWLWNGMLLICSAATSIGGAQRTGDSLGVRISRA